MATNSSFTALPDDVLQRVLLGVALDDHDATAAACRAFRAVIRGPRFLRLRREYGFAERGVILVGRDDDEAPLEIYVAGNPGAIPEVAVIPEGLNVSNPRGSTTDGGGRLFVSVRQSPTAASPSQILVLNASSRRWRRFAILPDQSLHCMEWHGGLLYVAGGEVSSPVNTLYAFNEVTGLWDDLPPMPHASTMAASGVIGNELFIAGGRGVGNQRYLSTLQIYDFTTRTWRLGAPLPHALRGACGVVVDGKLYLVSTRLSVRRSTLVYDVQSNTWDQQIPPPYAPAEDLHAMYAFTHNGRIVVVYANGTAFHRGSGSDPDWYPFDLGVTSGPDHGVAGSIILG